MTLKEFLENYVSSIQYVSVYVHGNGSFGDTVIYLASAGHVLESDLWARFFEYKVSEVFSNSDGLGINIKENKK